MHDSLLTEFENLIEQMIALQTKEQTLILERKTDSLPATSQSIEWLGNRLQTMERAVRQELESEQADGKPHPHQGKIQEKLGHVRRLAQQNRTLLQHSLFFLQKLFQQVLDRDCPLPLYNQTGHALTHHFAGSLIETRA